MKKSTNLHKIGKQLSELEDRKNKLHSEEYKKFFQDTQKFYNKLLKNTDFKFSLTDHAVVEYQNDIEFLPPAQVKFNILYSVESYIKDHPNINVKALKDAIYKPNINGVVYVIKNNKIITVYPSD
jgi:hypothetical protein